MFTVLMMGTKATFDQLLELPMNMAGYMSIERAGFACDDKINEAVEITINEANVRCEESVRRNLNNIERKDEDTMYQVMEATRKQEETFCQAKIEQAVLETEEKFESQCTVRVEEAERVENISSHGCVGSLDLCLEFIGTADGGDNVTM